LAVSPATQTAFIQERVRAGLQRARKEGKRLGRTPIAPKLKERIQEALAAPGRTEGVRKIAQRMGVNPSTVQTISMELAGRPFAGSAVA
jgi:DNA invertase Pin-like site-specific DNA recombinase